MAERRDVRQQRWIDVLARDEQLDGLDAHSARRIDEVLALAHEQPELLALPRRCESPHELQRPIVSRGNQATLRAVPCAQ